MNLTNRQIQNLLQAHLELTGFVKAVPQGDGKPDALVREPYRLSAVTRLKIAHNIRRLRDHVETFNEAAEGLLRDLSGGTMEINPEAAKDDADKAALRDRALKFAADRKTLLATPVEVDVQPIAMAELVRDDEKDAKGRVLPPNPIDPAILATLLDIAQ